MRLTMDGGGTKIVAVLYDDDYAPVAVGRSGGVNSVQNTPENVREHIRQCLDQVLAGGVRPERIDAVLAGDRKSLEEDLRRRGIDTPVNYLFEGYAGLLAGACRNTGFLLLSGTGSDTFYMKDGKNVSCIGGWGPVLGDQGSGVWIGLQAIRSVARAANGWGEKTLLTETLDRACREIFGGSVYQSIVSSPAPYAAAARMVPEVAEAARAGDETALCIFRRAGELMARQMEPILQRHPEIEDRDVILCGGAWKAHEAMLDSCQTYLRRIDPAFTLHRPMFEHVCAGMVLNMLGEGMNGDDIRHTLAEKEPQFIINREEALL